VIAVAVGLVAISVALTGLVVTMGVWLHSANADRLNAADLIDGQRKLVAEYKSKYDTEFVAHTVTSERLKTEQNLRAIAEAQRTAAQQKTQRLLAQHLTSASEDQVVEIVRDVFSTPLSLIKGDELERP